jgi:plastocyanin
VIRRWSIGLTISALVAGAAFLATAVAQEAHSVKALDPSGDPPAAGWIWDPGVQDGPEATFEVAATDTVSWEFDQAGQNHNLLLKVPGEDPVNLGQAAGCGTAPFYACLPNSPAIEYTIEEGAAEGTYVYFCTLHGGNPEGTAGMSGKFTFGDPGGGGPQPLPNPSQPPEEWEVGDNDPPKLTDVSAKGIRRGAKVRFTLSEPATVTVRFKRDGKTVYTKRLKDLPEGVTERKITSSRLKRGKHKVVLTAVDEAGNKSGPTTRTVTVKG